MTVYMWIASLSWLLIVLGYSRRKNRKLHVRLALTGIGIDFLLVLYLQVTRNAVQTALDFSLSLPQQLHILCSTAALVCYFPILFLGIRLWNGTVNAGVRRWHVRIATTALILRTAGFCLMFSMWRD